MVKGWRLLAADAGKHRFGEGLAALLQAGTARFVVQIPDDDAPVGAEGSHDVLDVASSIGQAVRSVTIASGGLETHWLL